MAHIACDREKQIRASIVSIGKFLYDKDFVGACSGNISVRLSKEIVLITSTASHLGFLKEEDLAVVTMEANIVSGQPSSELPMHLEVYRNCIEATAIVHAHPPIATAWTIARPDLDTLPMDVISEAILCAGNIPIVPYVQPGTSLMGTVLHPYLPENKILLLSHHGSLCWGTDLNEAFLGTERLEHLAKTLMYSHLLGGLNSLPKEEVESLRDMKYLIGNKVL